MVFEEYIHINYEYLPFDAGSAPKKRSQKRMKPKRCKEEEEEALPAQKDISSNAVDYTTEPCGSSQHLQQQPETDATSRQQRFWQHFLISILYDVIHNVSHSGSTFRQVDDKVQVVTFYNPRKKQKTKQTPAVNVSVSQLYCLPLH